MENTRTTSDDIHSLKQTQTSIRERLLARKKVLQPQVPLNKKRSRESESDTIGRDGITMDATNPATVTTTITTYTSATTESSSNNDLPYHSTTASAPVTKASIADVEDLLNRPSIKEREVNKVGNELLELLEKQSVKEKSLSEKFKTKGGPKVTEYCPRGTRDECKRERAKLSIADCDKIHFRRIIKAHTDTTLGDCSYLDTCRHMKTCKFVHYELDNTPVDIPTTYNAAVTYVSEPQWICCDLRKIDLSVLGQFSVIMADPPWDIRIQRTFPRLNLHKANFMTQLIYGVAIWMSATGRFFLFVGHRQSYGAGQRMPPNLGAYFNFNCVCFLYYARYERVEEIIWVKTNQLQRIIRTGRTGHWLNHSKEHCLVGMKGKPTCNRFLDCDVVVAEVRETSRKPDEIYGLIERLSPGSRKLELFGRPHNAQPGWLTLGNQLDGIQLHDPQFRKLITEHLAQIQ